MEDNEIIISSDEIVSQSLPENVREFRNKLIKYKVPEVDQYGDGFLAQAYLAAKSSTTGTYASIRKELKLDNLTFQYYMENYPDFVAAIKIGLYDSRKEKLSDLEGSLLSRAMGVEVEETKVEESGIVDEDGNMKNIARKKTVTKKQIPPDVNAIMTLLQKMDPSYNPKSTLDININQTLNVEEDINVNVDYRMLSTTAIKELLESNKLPQNNEVNKTPGGKSVRFLGEDGEKKLEKRREKLDTYKEQRKIRERKEKEENKNKKKRVMSAETRAKISEAMKNRYKKNVTEES